MTKVKCYVSVQVTYLLDNYYNTQISDMLLEVCKASSTEGVNDHLGKQEAPPAQWVGPPIQLLKTVGLCKLHVKSCKM